LSEGNDETGRTRAKRRQAEILALLRAGRQSVDGLMLRLQCSRRFVANDISRLRQQGFTIETTLDVSGSYYELMNLPAHEPGNDLSVARRGPPKAPPPSIR
jgi:biotin operon repressor